MCMQNVLYDFLHGAFSVRNEIYDFFRFFIILLDIFLVGLIQCAGLDNLLISRVNDNLWEIIIVHDDMQLSVVMIYGETGTGKELLAQSIHNADRNVLDAFYAYDWPGNVRELQHAVEHAMNVLPDAYSMITAEYIPEHIGGAAGQTGISAPDKQRDSLASTMKDVEYNTICRVLKETGGNISESARILQMSRQKLQYRIKRHRIDVQKLRE